MEHDSRAGLHLSLAVRTDLSLLTAKPPVAYTLPQRICFSPPTVQFIVCKHLIAECSQAVPLWLFVSVMRVGRKYRTWAEV